MMSCTSSSRRSSTIGPPRFFSCLHQFSIVSLFRVLPFYLCILEFVVRGRMRSMRPRTTNSRIRNTCGRVRTPKSLRVVLSAPSFVLTTRGNEQQRSEVPERKNPMKNVLQPAISWLKAVFEEQKHDRQKNTIAVLDGVRACAILFVIIFHINRMTGDRLWDWHTNPLASSISTAGGTGVTLFFVLSGFLLFMPYAKALLTDSRWPLARTFYLRRALRIMPG